MGCAFCSRSHIICRNQESISSRGMGFVTTGRGFKRRRFKRGTLTQSIAFPVDRVPRGKISTPERAASPSPASFDDLPPEVYYRIFCYAGFDSSLPLTSSYFYALLNPHNSWFLEMVVSSNFVIDLNASFLKSRKSWKKKFATKLAEVPKSFQDTDQVNDLFHVPQQVLLRSRAIDSRLFQLRFVTAEVVAFVHKRFGGIVVDSATVETELAYRERYLEWRYMVLRKYSKVSKEIEESGTPEEAKAKAEDDERCVAFSKKHDLTGYLPLMESVDIPADLLRRANTTKLHKMAALHNYYGMGVLNFGALVSAVLRSSIDEPALTALILLAPKKYTQNDVVAILAGYETCRNQLLALPREQRGEHAAVVDGALLFVKDSLVKFYSDTHERDDEIWALIKQLQIPELLDVVVNLGVSPALHIF